VEHGFPTSCQLLDGFLHLNQYPLFLRLLLSLPSSGRLATAFLLGLIHDRQEFAGDISIGGGSSNQGADGARAYPLVERP